MKAELTISQARYLIDLADPLDISIPLIFNGEQPNMYGVPKASARAYEDGQFVGDTRRGGSSNFEEVRLIPHCNGTHTEGVGHLALARISVHTILTDAFIPATLVTLRPAPAEGCTEQTRPTTDPTDLLLTAELLLQGLPHGAEDFLHGLIIRTLPNDIAKRSQKYGEPPPPYFTIEAMKFINKIGVQHLLVDTPSVDRTHDEGKMTAHHIYWDVPEGSHEVDPEACSLKTITEMIFVPDSVADGLYVLNLQIPNFVADAAPSRPILYAVKQQD